MYKAVREGIMARTPAYRVNLPHQPAPRTRSRTMDDFHARALKSLRERHENKIRQDAEEIQEYIGYVLARTDKGVSGALIGNYASTIAADAQEIVTRIAALEAMKDATGILETRDEPTKEQR
jgi:hypothetical protein